MVSMTSFEILPSEPTSEVQDAQSAEFIIFPNTIQGEMVNGFASGDGASADLIAPDLTTAEMCDRLKKLLCENVELKDMVRKNNQVMHEQLSTIAAWHEQISQTNNKHHTMIEDYVRQNEKLQSEKEELEKKIETFTETLDECQETVSDYSLLKGRCFDLGQQLSTTLAEKERLAEALKQIETNRTVGEGRNLEQMPPEVGNGSLTTLFTDDESDYAIIIKEDFPLQKSDNNQGFEDIFSKYGQLQAKVGDLTQELQEEKLKSENLIRKITEEKERELKNLQCAHEDLKQENTENLSIISTLNDDKIKMAFSLQEVQDSCAKNETLEGQLKFYKEKLESLQLSNFENASRIEKLQKESERSAEELGKQLIQNKMHKKGSMAAEKNYKQLHEEHEGLIKLLSEQSHDFETQRGKMSTDDEMQREKYQDQLDLLTARLLDMEQHLQAEQDKVYLLKREVTTLTEDSECIPILKAQVEVFKTELEAEKIARSDTALKEMALNQEVTDLNEQIKGLQEIIQNGMHVGSAIPHRGSHPKVARTFGAHASKHSHGRSSNSRRGSNTSSDEASAAPQFLCPCCPLTFTDLGALQNHVEECLNEVNSTP